MFYVKVAGLGELLPIIDFRGNRATVVKPDGNPAVAVPHRYRRGWFLLW